MKKVVLCMAVVAVLAMTSLAPAVQIYTQWKGVGAGAGNWSDPANWSLGVPVANDAGGVHVGDYYKAGFKTPGNYPLLTSGTYAADILVFGGANPSNTTELVVNGATVNVSEYITLAAGSTDVGYLTLQGGAINTGVNFNNTTFFVSQLGRGTLEMSGGTITCGLNYPTPAGTYGNFNLSGTSGAGNGIVNMTGGNIYANSLVKGTGTGLFTIGSQTAAIWLVGDKTGAVQLAIDDGWLAAGPGLTVDYLYDDLSNVTKVFATPEPATVCLLGLGVLGLLRRKK